ncbi:MAG: hypothetical protein CSA21_03475 [Deltaproteobacteria bacterium]|nr:MAG: hypothetical protein CSA21_03475 [Deltaproteobacteria bacterium]
MDRSRRLRFLVKVVEATAAATAVFVGLALPSVCIGSAARDVPVRLVYLISEGKAAGQQVTITATPERTCITSPEQTLEIRYRELEVLRATPPDEAPVRYPLNHPDQPRQDSFAETMRSRLASYTITDGGETVTLQGLKVRRKTVHFGYDLMVMRAMVPYRQNFFGEVFGERTLHYQVSVHHKLNARLRALTASRQEVVAANPLLLQLDLINLMPLLGGLPLRITDWQFGNRSLLEFVPLDQ